MKIYWATHFKIMLANAAGYTLSNYHLRVALHEIGVEHADDAKVAIHLCHPADFKPVPGKKNCLFTMFESTPVPEIFGQAFQKADLILVPSRFCEQLFAPMKGKKRMFVNKLGFDEKTFPYVERKWTEGDDYQALWLGAPNARKGWPHALYAFTSVFRDQPWAHLTMKTTTGDGKGKVEQRDNIVFDSRSYSDVNQLSELYQKAHCFLFPTMGEGFGLTALEALATGCPTIYTNYGGQLDFLDVKWAWPVTYVIDTVDQTDGNPYDGAFADPPKVARAMVEILSDYPAALAKAKLGSDFVHANFTWKHAARQLVKNLERSGLS